LETSYILILLILFAATFVRSAFGFGDALIAMPLLTFLIDIKVAAPIVAFMSSIIAIYIIIGNYKQIKIKAIWQLIVFSIIGIPIGLIYLEGAGENLIKIILGIILIFFSLYKLYKPDLLNLKNDKYGWISGLIAGVLGGAYNTNGPPIIIYGSMRNWKPAEFRAILQGIFFPTNLFIVAGHGVAGNWTEDVMKITLYALPVVLFATLLGGYINKRIPAERFAKFIYFMLIVIALTMISATIF
jgi:uncharacterized membrane protein YfcA